MLKSRIKIYIYLYLNSCLKYIFIKINDKKIISSSNLVLINSGTTRVHNTYIRVYTAESYKLCLMDISFVPNASVRISCKKADARGSHPLKLVKLVAGIIGPIKELLFAVYSIKYTYTLNLGWCMFKGRFIGVVTTPRRQNCTGIVIFESCYRLPYVPHNFTLLLFLSPTTTGVHRIILYFIIFSVQIILLSVSSPSYTLPW